MIQFQIELVTWQFRKNDFLKFLLALSLLYKYVVTRFTILKNSRFQIFMLKNYYISFFFSAELLKWNKQGKVLRRRNDVALKKQLLANRNMSKWYQITCNHLHKSLIMQSYFNIFYGYFNMFHGRGTDLEEAVRIKTK